MNAEALQDRPRDERLDGEAALEAPAGDYLARVPWEGASPDPDELDAATFLAWL
jgi:hypothetical protein